MSFRIKCPCGATISARPEHFGKLIGCPKCNRRLKVNQPANAANPVTQQAPPQKAPPQKAPQQRVSRPVPAQQSGNFHSDPFAQSHTTHSQPAYRRQQADSNRTLMIGGLIATGLVALVVVSLAGMFLLQRTGTAARDTASTDQSSSTRSTRSPTPTPRTQAARQPADDTVTLELADLIDIVEPSVVRIDVKSSEGSCIGSGVFVEDEGLIVTNYHVVQGALEVKITGNDGQTTMSKGFYHADPLKDLAVIKVDSSKIPVTSIPLSSELPRKGEDVAAFGSPLGFNFSATQGVVSSVRNGEEARVALKGIVGLDIYSLLGYSTKTNWIQMTAAISGGNSGGPLVNMQGELVGINTWTHPAGQNLNFASTIDEIKSVLDVSDDATLKDFSRLPKQRINLQFAANPSPGSSRGGRGDVASNSGGSRSNSNSRGPRINPSRNPGSSGTITILTPEEAAEEKRKSKERGIEIRARMHGTELIVMASAGEAFQQDDEPDVSRSFETNDGLTVDISKSADDRFLAATSKNGTCFVFNNRGELIYKIESTHKLIRRTQFTAQPCQLCTIKDQTSQNAVQLRNPATGEMDRGVKNFGLGEADFIAVSPNGLSLFASWVRHRSRSPSEAKFWRFDAVNDRETEGDVSPVYGGAVSERSPVCAEFSSGGVLITGFDDGWVSVTGYSDSKLTHIGAKPVHRNIEVADLAVARDGRSFVSGGPDGQVALTTINGKSMTVTKLGAPGSSVLGVAYSSDGQLVAATRENQRVDVYNVATSQLVKSISAQSICTGIEFFGDNQFVVVGARDGKIRFFKAR